MKMLVILTISFYNFLFQPCVAIRQRRENTMHCVCQWHALLLYHWSLTTLVTLSNLAPFAREVNYASRVDPDAVGSEICASVHCTNQFCCELSPVINSHSLRSNAARYVTAVALLTEKFENFEQLAQLYQKYELNPEKACKL